MIPLRVKLKGFLCYKEEQEVTFDGSSLWMLSGLNGSGKSAVFDAVTYALFGHHRGGSQKVEELINKNSEGLEVEFDFLQDGQAYRLRRTAKRKSIGGVMSGQQIYKRLSANGTGHGKWEALPDAQKKTDFDAWVRDNIGLNYDTFTSSVLLLQGKAEKLLDSTAKGRFEVLAGIVDLERYQKLHQKADDERRESEAGVKSIRDRLAALPEVTALELLEAEAAVQAAEADKQSAWQEVERLQSLEFQARQWQGLHGRLSQTREKLRQAETLLADAAAIDRDDRRLKQLQAVLPSVKTAMEQQRGIEETARKIADLDKHEKKIADELTRHDEDIARTRRARATLEAAAAGDESRLRDVTARLRSVTGLLEKLREYERTEQDLARLRRDLEALPPDPAADLKRLREECDRLAALAQLAPQLGRLADLRRDLADAIDKERSAAEARRQVEARGKQLKAEAEALKGRLADAACARQEADDQFTRAKTLLEQADASLRDLLLVRGAKVCRHCGQELTAGHIQEEKVRRERELAQAQQHHDESAGKQRDAHAAAAALTKESERLDQVIQQAREEFLAQRLAADQAGKDVERLRSECSRLHDALPEAYRQRTRPPAPGAWEKTAYPTPDDLTELKAEAQKLTAAKGRLRDAETAHEKWGRLKAQEATLSQNLHRLERELPADRAGLREDHARLEAEEKSLEASQAARKKALADNQKEIDRQARLREQTAETLAKCRGDIQTQTTTQRNFRSTLDRVLKELPADWRGPVAAAGLADLNRWLQERSDLVARGTEERARDLQQARLSADAVRAECSDLEAQLAGFPEEARRPPEAVQGQAAAAKQLHLTKDKALSDARQSLALLEGRHKQREQLQQEYLEVDRRLSRSRLLAELLGRERLQLHLVRQAERQVVDHANSVLDRLTGGELYLRLCGEAGGEGNSAKALELEAHNRVTGEKPINVAFLSGSQKFRVAVSLALGIGQYASRQHRPIESVIIDEGFGCLDRNARQVMIQELQNLRSQMRCILLVSHQEEFADAFPDGYHFELRGGSTVARRFQR